jgi:hypothetical protein
MTKKCECLKKNGEKCAAYAPTGKSVCIFHDPAREAYGRRARRAGGLRRRRAVAVLPSAMSDHPFIRAWVFRSPNASALPILFSCHPESRVLVCQHRDDLSENHGANKCQVRFYRRISQTYPRQLVTAKV